MAIEGTCSWLNSLIAGAALSPLEWQQNKLTPAAIASAWQAFGAAPLRVRRAGDTTHRPVDAHQHRAHCARGSSGIASAGVNTQRLVDQQLQQPVAGRASRRPIGSDVNERAEQAGSDAPGLTIAIQRRSALVHGKRLAEAS